MKDTIDIQSFLTYVSENYGDKTAFSWYSQNEGLEESTYNEFVAQVYQTASALAPILGEEKRVAIIAPNSYEWMVYYWGVMLLGKSAVLVDPELPWDEVEQRLQKLDVRTAFVSEGAGNNGQIKKIQMQISCLEKGVNLDFAVRTIDKSQADQEGTVLFTTGTTGGYKGVCLTQKNIVFAISPGTTELANTVFIALPFFHSFSITGLITAMHHGRKVFIGRGPKYTLKDILLFEPELILVTPIYLRMFYKRLMHSDIKNNYCEKLFGPNLHYVVTGGARPQKEVLTKLEKCNIRILSVYGSSETFCIASGEIGAQENYVGKISPYMNVKLKDGEVTVRGRTVFSGYAGEKDNAGEDFWYHTGDIGYLDAENNLFLTGRKKNLIILSNGKNVSPEYLESELRRIHDIEEAVVYESQGKICAEIYIGNNPAEDKKAMCREQIAEMNSLQPTYYQIQKIVFRGTAFPRSGTGKIMRSAIDGSNER